MVIYNPALLLVIASVKFTSAVLKFTPGHIWSFCDEKVKNCEAKINYIKRLFKEIAL